MSRAIQIRRGSAAEHNNFTGLVAEITYDTTNKTLRVHDGQTPGGVVLARADDVPTTTIPASADYVIETQAPTAENNYTWYRKYKSGWVEQGGKYANKNQTITLPIPMSDANYPIMLSFCTDSTNTPQYASLSYKQTGKTPQSFVIWNVGQINGQWCVCGFMQQ